MNGKERIQATLEHREPDKVAMDLGGTAVTGIAASALQDLKQVLGVPGAEERTKVVDPFQMLGEVTDALRDELGIDTQPVSSQYNFYGFKNENWKPWVLFDGTPVLVPGKFNTEPDEDGDIYQYPQGDRSVEPCAKMPRDGYYFDAIMRQPPIDDEELDPADNCQEFGPIGEDELDQLRGEVERLKANDDRALVGNFLDVSFGDIALVPGPTVKHPRGIRDVEEWYVSTVTRREYVREVFRRQCEIGIEDLEKIHDELGEAIDVVFITGTDFGTQNGPFISPDDYRDLYKPFHQRVNNWIHENTTWKTFIHSCGGVEPLIDEFVDAGFDILNPVQCSAEDMDPEHLKEKFGDRITFWGGAIDTQKTLPFGTPEEVREQVRRRVDIFAQGGGFVFNAIHNIQARTPPENLEALFKAFQECRE